MKNQKSKLKYLHILIIAIVFGISAYLLADRYLIDKVEISHMNVYVSSVATQPDTAQETAVSTIAPTLQSTVTKAYDDWNYSSDKLSIAITRVITGSGGNRVTCFVADVVVSDATPLQNAFANDPFGQNIIDNTFTIAEQNDAVFAINGDLYGFHDDGIVFCNEVIYRVVPARVGLAFYRDGTMKVYDETTTSAMQLIDEGVWNTYSFWPALLIDSVVQDNTSRVEVDTNFGNHTIQGNQPRTGIGIISPNNFVFVIVDGRSQ